MFQGKKVLITAGPTQEAIDPVRFISNHSTGKMGYAIAQAFEKEGAIVTLVSGPVNIQAPDGVEVIAVKSAQEMFEATKARFAETDITVLAAAVADYTPMNVSDIKLKKSDDDMVIQLKRTADIAKSLGEIKTEKQFTLGFALETNNELENAQGKLQRKNFDAIVLNSLQDKGAGFGGDTNKIMIIDHNSTEEFQLKSKKEVAYDIISYIHQKLAS